MNRQLILKSLKNRNRFLLFHIHHNPISTTQSIQVSSHPLTSPQCGSLLQSFTNTKSLVKGKQLHACIITCGLLLQNTYLNTKLAALYAICGSMNESRLMFDEIALRSSFLWNSMIRGYACNGFSSHALDLYDEMLSFGQQKPDKFTYPFVLKACGDLLLVKLGNKIHCQIVTNGFESDIYVANSLLAMYSRFGDMGSARRLFDRMPLRDLTSWNTMISGYAAKNHQGVEALLLFRLMLQCGGTIPDSTTLLSVLPACCLPSHSPDATLVKEIHAFIFRINDVSDDNSSIVTNSLIDVYSKCGCLVNARQLFEKMTPTTRDTVTWNSIISGYAHTHFGDAFESLRLFCRMVSEGRSHPDQVTLITVLAACHQITALPFGTSLHSFILRKGFSAYTTVGTSLLDMYAKSGSLACSRRVFDNDMPNKNLVSWSAMLGAYGLHGKGIEAVALFNEMEAKRGIQPDDVTFTSVLSACSHAGLVDEGRRIFNKMVKGYSIIPPKVEHYSCMVDLLGRAGLLDEAYHFINAMKIVKPNSDIWAALLSACSAHRNVELAEVAANNAFDLNPKRVSPYVMLSNIYAAEKRWEDVERVRGMVRQMGLKKPPGFTYIELDKVVHRFLVGDKSHSQWGLIYTKLEDLRHLLNQAGYKPDTSSVFYNVKEDVKEKMLWDHSERLAIAFALINSAPGTVIRITKNLRVCGDCHAVIKLISKLTAREIVMRDSHRFHHFSNGFCSCGDYW